MEKIILFVLCLSQCLFLLPDCVQATSVCGKGWHYFKSSCYTWRSPERKTHKDAENFCKKLNSSLANVKNQETYHFVRENVLKTNESGFWSALHRCHSTRFYWTDKSPAKFTSFMKGEPNNHEGNENCVEVYSDATWNDQDCVKRTKFICQNLACARNISNSDNFCLYTSHRRATWLEAKEHCEKAGDMLVKIRNAMINIAAMRLTKGSHGFWIGLRKQDVLCWQNEGRALLEKGRSACEESSSERCNCVAMGDNRTWIEASCQDKQPFVCEKDANECKDSSNECHKNGICVNNIGSYTCHCNHGYIGNGKFCVEPANFDIKMININNTKEVKSVIKTCAGELRKGNHSEDVLKVLEHVTLSVGKRLKNNTNGTTEFVMEEENIILGVVLIKKENFQGFTYPDDVHGSSNNQEKIVFPKSILPSDNGDSTVVIGMVYNTPKEMNSIAETDWFVNSKTVAGIIDPKPEINLRNPVKIVFKKLKNVVNGKIQCVFWKFSDGGKGTWSTDGCYMSNSNSTHVTCECYHLTNFAILMRIKSDETSGKDNIVLNIITFIGLGTSIVGCILTLLIHLYFPKLRRDRGYIHINLVSALGLADVVFMIAILVDQSDDSCTAMALLIFYFFLALFFWMLVEGFHIYIMVTKVFDTKGRKLKCYYSLIGWVSPLIIVGLTYACLQSDILSNEYCWLSVSSGAIWGFVGPVTFIILVNVVIMILVLKVTLTMLPEDPENGRIKSAFRTFLMLTPVLGVTWIFGVFTITKHSNVFQYIFAILNSFQGLIIFVLYCIFNKEARRELKRKLKSIRSSREISISRRKSSSARDRMSRTSSKSSLGATSKKEIQDTSPAGKYTLRNRNDITGNATSDAANFNFGMDNEHPMPEIYPLGERLNRL